METNKEKIQRLLTKLKLCQILEKHKYESREPTDLIGILKKKTINILLLSHEVTGCLQTLCS